jgi:nucleotide-binding universal stress UspA family protein
VYEHILACTDGSELAGQGLDHAFRLAKELSSKVTIVTVTEPAPLTGTDAVGGWIPMHVDRQQYASGLKQHAEKILSDAKNAAVTIGVAAETVYVPDAWPAVAIVATAESRHCDLIVMASHGRRGLGRMLLGSQTSDVLVTSTIPVLVIRASKSGDAGRSGGE